MTRARRSCALLLLALAACHRDQAAAGDAATPDPSDAAVPRDAAPRPDATLPSDPPLDAGPATTATLPGWQWQNPLPCGNDLTALWSDGAGTSVAVGRAGTILRRTPAQGWTLVPSGTTADLSAITGLAGGLLYAVGGAGTVVTSNDAGATWSARSLGALTLTSVAARAPGDLFVTGWYQGIGFNKQVLLHATAGSPFTVVNGLPPTSLGAVSGDARALYLQVGNTEGGFTLLRSTDGATFLPVRDGLQQALYVSTTGAVCAQGTDGSIVRSADGVDDWSATPLPLDDSILGIGGGLDGSLYAASLQGTLFAAPPGGYFSLLAGPPAGQLYGVTGDSPGHHVAVGAAGVVLEGGATAGTLATPGPRDSLNDLWGEGDELFAVGDGGTILHSLDAGASWTRLDAATTVPLLRVWGWSATDLLIAGGDGTLLHSTDHGATWSLIDTGTADDLGALVAVAPDTVYLVGNRGSTSHVLVSTDHAATFRVLHQSQFVDGVVALAVHGPVLCALGTIQARSTDGGLSWTETAGNRPSYTDVWSNGAGRMVAVGLGGVLATSDDDCATWTAQPSKSSDYLLRIAAGQPGELWALGGADNSNLLGSSLLRSTDAGQTWTREEGSPSDRPLRAVWANAQHTWIAGSAGAILRR